MFGKSEVVKEVVNDLLENDFDIFFGRGCFDIVAKREKLLMIKCLANVDSLNSNQAKDLTNLSYFLSGYPFVISLRNNRSRLIDNLVYSRFDLPVMTPNLFKNVLSEDAYFYKSAKGKHTVKINTNALKTRRYELRFTLDELSNLVGISKKAMYEIESDRTNPTESTLDKLENVLKINLKVPYEPREMERKYARPSGGMQKKVNLELDRIGLDNAPVKSAPFEIVGKEKFSFITGITYTTKKIEKSAGILRKLSGLFESDAFFVAKESEVEMIEGLPVFLEDELPQISSAKELKKRIEEHTE